MTLRIVTGAWGPRAQFYTDTFCEPFHRFWPAEVELNIYGDQSGNTPRVGGTRYVQLPPAWRAFVKRHGADPERNGRKQRAGWKGSDRLKGYSFRFDAVRFAGQAFAPLEASRDMADGDVLCWLDADVTTHDPVPAGFIEGLLGDAEVAYLGRGKKHSEIGFWACRLSFESRAFLARFAQLYTSDELFQLAQWHSAFVWDHARRAVELSHGLRTKDLTPGGTGHVWFESPLARYMDHLKGEARKAAGRSPERR